jgi:hypothetical protein
VKFRAGELEFNATVADGSQAPSPQTGNMLRSLTIQFRAQKLAMHEQALVAAVEAQSGGLFSIGESDEPETEFRVRDSSSTYIGTEPYGINHHVWQIEQVERIACERLIVGPVELEPYEYLEQVSDAGVVRLAARALVSEADLEALSRLVGVADVTRLGISDTPRSMLVDGYVWGDGPAGLGLALACTDVREPRVTLEYVQPPPRDDGFEELITLLLARGVLGEQDAQEFAERMRQRRHAARRVANIDGWKL